MWWLLLLLLFFFVGVCCCSSSSSCSDVCCCSSSFPYLYVLLLFFSLNMLVAIFAILLQCVFVCWSDFISLECVCVVTFLLHIPIGRSVLVFSWDECVCVIAVDDLVLWGSTWVLILSVLFFFKIRYIYQRRRRSLKLILSCQRRLNNNSTHKYQRSSKRRFVISHPYFNEIKIRSTHTYILQRRIIITVTHLSKDKNNGT